MSAQDPDVTNALEIEVPLVVDVDGVLVATDLLQEAALQYVARYPLRAYRIPLWLIDGKSNLKIQLANRVNPGIGTVPLRQEVLTLIRDAQATGRPVYLASASDRRYIVELAERIGGIAGVFGTDSDRNLAGEAKADRLVSAFGVKGFDYIGDAPSDFAVWRCARRSLVVAHSAEFRNKSSERLSGCKDSRKRAAGTTQLLRSTTPAPVGEKLPYFPAHDRRTSFRDADDCSHVSCLCLLLSCRI